MSTRVILNLSDNEAGELMAALGSTQIETQDNGDALRAYRLGKLIDKINHARWEAQK